MMKRIITLLLAVAALFCRLPVICAAEAANDRLDSYSAEINERLDSAIDDDTRRLMRENGAENNSLNWLTPGRILQMIADRLAVSADEPLRMTARLTAVLLLTALVKSMVQGALSQGFSAVGTIAAITLIYHSVYDAFNEVCAFLDRLSAFMLSYIPIFASVNAASGNFAAGGSYYAAALGICELIGFVSKSVIMSFLSLFMALSFAAAVNPDMHFSEAAASVKNAVKLTLNALMTIFTSSMAVKSISGAAADSAAARAVRFGVSSFVPIIGGSVSEAYSSVYAGVGVIRSGVGTVGITVIGFMLLQPIATLMLVRAALGAATFISELLGLKEPAELMKSTSYAMSAAISTVLCFAMMFIISTSVVMLTAANR